MKYLRRINMQDKASYYIIGPLHVFITRGAFWFRLPFIGISGKDTRRHQLMFSERNGYKKRLQIGNWSFRIL